MKCSTTALAVVVLMLFTARGGAQDPLTQDTFTMGGTGVLTVIPYHSYYTYSLTSFDGDTTATGTVVDHLDGGWDFNLPNATYTDCLPTTTMVSQPTRLQSTTYTTYACQGATINTVSVKNFHQVGCSGRGQRTACYAETLPRPDVTGTETKT
jgi:hypothetical protein